MNIKNAMMQKTKIIATMGPTFEEEDKIIEMFKNGVTVVRLNTSHGDVKEHQERIMRVKKIRQELDLPITILLDTKGPEIRVGEILNKKMLVKRGDILKINSGSTPFVGKELNFWVTYTHLTDSVVPGSKVLVDDGKLSLNVISVDKKNKITTLKAENNHYVGTKKAINIPNANLKLPFIADHDKKFLEWGVKQGIDYVAASFVRDHQDLIDLRKLLDSFGGKNVRIMSKIEALKAIENLNKIIIYSDAIMLARGDLGVEIPFYEVPFYEKLIINKCRAWGKPVVIATQMLDSMIDNPRPTRAEVTDVYYATISGADSTMLSGESASGNFPLAAVKVMARINIEAEKNFNYLRSFEEAYAYVEASNAESSFVVARKALNLDAEYILAFSEKGRSIHALSRFRPKAKILALIKEKDIVNKFGVNYAVYAHHYPSQQDFKTKAQVKKIALAMGINKGKKVIVANSKEHYILRV